LNAAVKEGLLRRDLFVATPTLISSKETLRK
jgi:hypothetical protein